MPLFTLSSLSYSIVHIKNNRGFGIQGHKSMEKQRPTFRRSLRRRTKVRQRRFTATWRALRTPTTSSSCLTRSRTWSLLPTCAAAVSTRPPALHTFGMGDNQYLNLPSCYIDLSCLIFWYPLVFRDLIYEWAIFLYVFFSVGYFTLNFLIFERTNNAAGRLLYRTVNLTFFIFYCSSCEVIFLPLSC